VLVDRVLQARVVNALEPEWEARFEPRSYGSARPGLPGRDISDIPDVEWEELGTEQAVNLRVPAAFDELVMAI
jgi:RNA-directed DNA polymerase